MDDNLQQKLRDLGLRDGEYIVVGSSVLGALGIREPDDIDLLVSQTVFETFRAAGWHPYTLTDQLGLKKDNFDVGTHWLGQTVTDLLPRAMIISGVPYASLADVVRWKTWRGRPKDRADIQLIKSYLATRRTKH